MRFLLFFLSSALWAQYVSVPFAHTSVAAPTISRTVGGTNGAGVGSINEAAPCTGTPGTFTFTLPHATSGGSTHLFVMDVLLYSSAADMTISSVTLGGAALTQFVASKEHWNVVGDYLVAETWYKIGPASSAAVVVTLSAACPADATIWIAPYGEYVTTLTAFTADHAAAKNTTCTTSAAYKCVGPTSMAQSGSNDVIIQGAVPNILITAIGSPYTAYTTSDGPSGADAINQFVPFAGLWTDNTSGDPVATNSASFYDTVAAESYATTFPATENPISESGNWVNGLATGLDWTNVQTTAGTPGLAFSTKGAGAEPPYNDSTAVLTGASWTSAQQGCGTVYANASETDGNDQEVAVRLNTTIAAHSITGYELVWHAVNDGTSYASIVRWNGALNNFTQLTTVNPGGGISNGDQVCATSIGGTLRSYINGAQTLTTTDSTYTGGSPGMGFDQNCPSSACDNLVGFNSYEASSQ